LSHSVTIGFALEFQKCQYEAVNCRCRKWETS